MSSDVYEQSQLAVAMLKSCIYKVLEENKATGLRNSQIATKLGIRTGDGKQRDWITKTILSMMEREEVVEQTENKFWHLK